MIKFQGKNVLIHSISEVISIKSFQKREVIIDDSWDNGGIHHSNFVLIEFSGDKMGLLDHIRPGQRVDVEGFVSGREYNNRIYNSIRGTSITPIQTSQQPAAPAPSPAPIPAAPSQADRSPQYPPRDPFTQPFSGTGYPGADNLPFGSR